MFWVVGPTKIIELPNGRLMIHVREELHPKYGEGSLYVGVDRRVVVTKFVPEGEEVPGELVNDTAGRVEALMWGAKYDMAMNEREALVDVMKHALKWLSPTQADELRTLYDRKVKG